MTNQNQTTPNYEVHCDNCGWWGYTAQLKTTFAKIGPDDISPEPCCPQCLFGWLEFSDNSLEIALINLEHTTKQFNQAMENLHCEISQLPN